MLWIVPNVVFSINIQEPTWYFFGDSSFRLGQIALCLGVLSIFIDISSLRNTCITRIFGKAPHVTDISKDSNTQDLSGDDIANVDTNNPGVSRGASQIFESDIEHKIIINDGDIVSSAQKNAVHYNDKDCIGTV